MRGDHAGGSPSTARQARTMSTVARAVGRWMLASAAAFAIVAVLAPPAFAHEGEEQPAKTSVLQAIAVIEAQPELTDTIADKIGDALDAEDTDGVDLDLVAQAQNAFDAGDLTRTETLLEEAVGSCPGAPVIYVPPRPRAAPPAAPCPVPQHVPALAGGRLGGAEGGGLIAGAVVLAAAGSLLAVRIR